MIGLLKLKGAARIQKLKCTTYQKFPTPDKTHYKIVILLERLLKLCFSSVVKCGQYNQSYNSECNTGIICTQSFVTCQKTWYNCLYTYLPPSQVPIFSGFQKTCECLQLHLQTNKDAVVAVLLIHCHSLNSHFQHHISFLTSSFKKFWITNIVNFVQTT